MSNRLRCAAALLLCAIPAVLAAQVPSRPPTALPPAAVGVIRGTVATETGQPIAAASVTVRSAKDSALVTGALTTAEGRFRIPGLAPGAYVMRVSQLGYRAQTLPPVTLTAAAAEVDVGAVRLVASPVELQGIEATAARQGVVMTADRTIYRTKEMPVASTGKAVDVLRGIPELEVDVNGKVTLRGNASVAIHLNDRPAPMRGEQLQQFLQQLPGNTIERVEVIPNPSARYDPEGLGGIVNIVLKSGVDLGLSGSVTANGSTRGQTGLSTRLAYQKGRATFFGGAGLMFYRMSISSHDLRENLLTEPLSWLDLTTAASMRQRFGMGDGTLEYKLDKKTTAWLSATAYPGSYHNDSDLGYLWLDSLQLPTSRYGRLTANGTGTWSANFVLGMRRQMQPQRHEWSLELRRNGNASNGDGRWTQQPLTLEGDTAEPPSLTLNDAHSDYHEWVGRADYTHPLGKKARAELGAQANERRNASANIMDSFAPGVTALPLTSTNMGYVQREELTSGYLTLVVPVRKLSLQGGLRGERARTTFEVTRTGQSYPNDYTSLFPSASALYDFGRGRQVRIAYSKRVDRPYAYYLNPDVPATDPFNRYMGNPYLHPRYTHSVSAEMSLTKANLTWRLAPYFRRTANDWDNIKSVDSLGVSTVTWANIRSVDSYGASFTTSLRQTKRLGGFASVNGYSMVYDAPGLSAGYAQRHFYMSANANASVKATKTLDAQLMLMYMPPRDLPQGRISSIVYSNLGLRQKLGAKGTANLTIMDPFSIYRYKVTTRDESHVQTSRSSIRMRSLSLSLSYAFGRPPQSARKPGQDDQQPPQPQQPDRPIR